MGLYAGLLVEPDGSRWQEPVTGTFLGTGLGRPVGANGQTIDDGGPTSWQANILTSNAKDSYREFALEFADRQLGYKSNSLSPAQRKPYVKYQTRNPACGQFWGWADESTKALTPPLATSPCPPNIPTPTPSIVTLTFSTGTYSLNYRNEPPPFRVDLLNGTQTSPEQTDLSHVFRSITRIDPAMNVQPTGKINPLCPGTDCFNFPPVQFGVGPTDPYTPMLRAYEGDKVQIRTLVGAHMSPHYFTVHGINWLFEPTDFDAADNTSGYRGTQGMGISEHYEALFTLPRTNAENGAADYLYSSSSDATGLANGNWGIMRAYRAKQPTPGLVPLPNNEPPATIAAAPAAPAVCPATAPVKAFSLVAARAIDVLGGPLVYNARGKAGAGGSKQIVNPKALAYFFASDLDGSGKLLPGTPVEPAILRANAGDCITVSIENRLPADVGKDRISTSLNIPIQTSPAVGLHPQLVAFDVTRSNGVNVGQNPVFTIASGASQTYTWYAGRIEGGAGAPNYIPVEFGSIPLTPSDPLMQHPYGLLGALIIEPADTSWRTDENSRASASVCKGNTSCASGDLLYREFVAILQDDVAGLVFTAPPVVGTHISGDVLNGKPTWTMNGQPLPAGGVKLAPGDTVTFDILNGTHGLLFASEAQAKQVFDIDGSPDKAKFQTFANQCTQANSYGTTPQSSGQIAKITAKQPFTLSPLNYECSQHCANMKGSFVLNTAGPTPPAPAPAPADAPTLSTPDDYTRAVNYRTEPLDYRYASADWIANDPGTSPIGIARALSNSLVLADPETPIFVATANTPVRFRVVHPAGLNEQVFVLHGHKWQEEPYINGSREIGSNAKSQSQGSRDGVGPNVAFDAVIDKAGGAGAVAGDYLYRTFIGNTFQPGLWGLFRVAAPTEDVVTITRFSNPKETNRQVLIAGTTTVDPGTGKRAATVTIFDTTAGAMKELGQADVDKLSGRWPKTGGPFKAPATVSSILVRSAGNGRATAGGYIAETPIETRVAPAGGPALAADAAPAGGPPPPPPPQRRARARAVQEDELSPLHGRAEAAAADPGNARRRGTGDHERPQQVRPSHAHRHAAARRDGLVRGARRAPGGGRESLRADLPEPRAGRGGVRVRHARRAHAGQRHGAHDRTAPGTRRRRDAPGAGGGHARRADPGRRRRGRSAHRGDVRHRAMRTPMRMFAAVLPMAALVAVAAVGARAQTTSEGGRPAPAADRVSREGLTIDFAVGSADTAAPMPEVLRAGDNAAVRFTIRAGGSGTPVSSLNPAAWVALARARPDAPRAACGDQARQALSPGFNGRPELDLNS